MLDVPPLEGTPLCAQALGMAVDECPSHYHIDEHPIDWVVWRLSKTLEDKGEHAAKALHGHLCLVLFVCVHRDRSIQLYRNVSVLHRCYTVDAGFVAQVTACMHTDDRPVPLAAATLCDRLMPVESSDADTNNGGGDIEDMWRRVTWRVAPRVLACHSPGHEGRNTMYRHWRGAMVRKGDAIEYARQVVSDKAGSDPKQRIDRCVNDMYLKYPMPSEWWYCPAGCEHMETCITPRVREVLNSHVLPEGRSPTPSAVIIAYSVR